MILMRTPSCITPLLAVPLRNRRLNLHFAISRPAPLIALSASSNLIGISVSGVYSRGRFSALSGVNFIFVGFNISFPRFLGLARHTPWIESQNQTMKKKIISRNKKNKQNISSQRIVFRVGGDRKRLTSISVFNGWHQFLFSKHGSEIYYLLYHNRRTRIFQIFEMTQIFFFVFYISVGNVYSKG